VKALSLPSGLFQEVARREEPREEVPREEVAVPAESRKTCTICNKELNVKSFKKHMRNVHDNKKRLVKAPSSTPSHVTSVEKNKILYQLAD